MNPSGSCAPSALSSSPAHLFGAETAQSPSDFDANNLAVVSYTHQQNSKNGFECSSPFANIADVIACSNFDDLLNLLELDAVGSIIFDSSVCQQEFQYISRWARIFKPNIQCIRHFPNSSISNAALFSGQ